MRLIRLHVTGFGNLRERVFEFGPGINLVIGPNEAGKSTLLHCLAQTLMGKPSKRSSFPDVQPWGLAEKGGFMAALEIAHGGQRFRLTRRFGETGAKAVLLQRLEADGTETVLTQDAHAIQNWVAESFGVADDTIFYQVFCLSQADLSPLKDNADLYERLDRAISGAEVAVAAAVAVIDDRVKALRRGMWERGARANWGPLQTAIASRVEAEVKLTEARQQDQRLAEARETLATADTQLTQTVERMTILTALLEQERERRSLHEKLDERIATFDVLEKQREQVEQLMWEQDRVRDELAKFPAEFGDPNAVRERLAGIDAARTDAERLVAERESLQQKRKEFPASFNNLTELRSDIAAIEQERTGPRWLIGIAVTLAVIGIAALFLKMIVTGILLFALGAPVVLWYALFRGQQHATTFYAALGVADAAEAEGRAAAVEELNRKLDAITLALQSADAATSGVLDVEEIRRKLTEQEHLREELSRVEGALAALPTLNELLERRRPISREISRLEDALRGMSSAPLSPEQEMSAARELKEGQERLITLRRDKSESERAVAVGEANEREIVALEDSVAYWLEEEVRLQLDEAALKMAREWLITAGETAHGVLIAPLEAGISPRFATMTGGRYPKTRVTTDAKTLIITPIDTEGKEVAFDQLSRGTRDQFVLAVRLALGEAIADGGEPLYFLDDPLLHFDEDRRREALAMLTEMAQTRQIVIVTHEADIREYLPDARVIEMGVSPSAVL